MKKVLTLALLASLASSVHAVLLDNDHVMSGTFLDTDTGLTWLDLRRTGSASYGYSNWGYSTTIGNNLLRYDDFRVANRSDVTNLINNVFSSLTYDSNGNYHYKNEWRESDGGSSSSTVYDVNFHDDFVNFYTVAGGTNYSSQYGYYYDSSSRGGHSALFGYFLDEAGNFDSLKIAEGSGSRSSCKRDWRGYESCWTSSAYKESSISFSDTNYTDSTKGPVWMIYNPTTSSVSEPGAFVLLGLGIIGLGFSRKMQRA